MTVYEQLHTGEIKMLRERYYELFGAWIGLNWEGCSTIESLKEYLRKEISRREKEIDGK